MQIIKQKFLIPFFMIIFTFVFSVGENFAQSGTRVADDCLDFANLYGPNILCQYGVFADPYRSTGVINGRHTVVGPGVDQYSGFSTVPPGHNQAVRLGNNINGAEAEAITYTYTVDTNQYDIILLTWSAVLQNPNHPLAQQPRFTFQLLNSYNMEIDPACGSADFIAGNTTQGWVNGGSATVCKNWTTVGFDVSAYHGQVVKIRLTTYDCSPTAHFAYAYFVLGCAKKRIEVRTCGNVEQVSYSAPEGFNYRWYWGSTPNQTISTNQTVTVSTSGSDILYCEASFTENPNCKFTLSTNVTTRFPLAQFNYSLEDCFSTIRFNNSSTISADGITPDGTDDPCTIAYWDFGNGTTSTTYSPNTNIPYPGPGTYNVTLVSGIEGLDGNCYDTTFQSITLPQFIPTLVGDTIVCKEDNATFIAGGGVEYLWSYQNDTASSIVVPDSGTYYVRISDTANACVDTLSIHVRYYDDFTVELGNDTTVCNNEGFVLDASHPNSTYLWNNESTDPTVEVWSEGDYTVIVTNEHGCSNTGTINMTFYPEFNPYIGEDTTLCDLATLVLDATTSGITGDTTYLWQDNSTNRTYTVYPQGGTYWVIVSDICYSKSDTINVDYLQLPTVNIGNDTVLCDGEPLILDATTPGYTYYWENDGSTKHYFLPKESGTYTVSVSGYCGTTSTSIEVTFRDCDIIIPNVFTPNGDGVNDEFQIGFEDDFEFDVFSFSIYIYDRWGRLVYHSFDANFKWNGKTNAGVECTDGVYYWKLAFSTYGGFHRDLNGTVTKISSTK